MRSYEDTVRFVATGIHERTGRREEAGHTDGGNEAIGACEVAAVSEAVAYAYETDAGDVARDVADAILAREPLTGLDRKLNGPTPQLSAEGRAPMQDAPTPTYQESVKHYAVQASSRYRTLRALGHGEGKCVETVAAETAAVTRMLAFIYGVSEDEAMASIEGAMG